MNKRVDMTKNTHDEEKCLLKKCCSGKENFDTCIDALKSAFFMLRQDGCVNFKTYMTLFNGTYYTKNGDSNLKKNTEFRNDVSTLMENMIDWFGFDFPKGRNI